MIVAGSSMNQVSIVDKRVADKRDNGERNSRHKRSIVAGSSNHVDNRSTDDYLAGRSCTVASSETLKRKRNFVTRIRVGRNAKRSPDEMFYLLESGKHGRKRSRRATQTKHAENSERVYHRVVARFSVIQAESTGLSLLKPDVLSKNFIQHRFYGAVFLSTAVLLSRHLRELFHL